MALEEQSVLLVSNGMTQQSKQRCLERAVVAYDNVHVLVQRSTEGIFVIQIVDTEILNSNISLILSAKLNKKNQNST